GSLLLNLEAPATIVLAVAFFGEHMGRREAVGAAVVVVGAAFLAIEPASGTRAGTTRGVLALTGACIAWGGGNNLTHRLSLRAPIALVRFKALAAGSGNLLIALLAGDRFPAGAALAGSVAVGVSSYGASIVLDAYALRFVGAAREAAYFATAPFFGALLSIPILSDEVGIAQISAAIAMGFGVWRLLRERHAHEHVHEALTHEHAHVHHAHHQPQHPPR